MASKAQSLDYRPSYFAAALAAAAVFGLYIFTLAPPTAMWDTSEYIAPHPDMILGLHKTARYYY